MMCAVRAAIERFDDSPEADAVGVAVLFCALWGGMMLVGGL